MEVTPEYKIVVASPTDAERRQFNQAVFLMHLFSRAFLPSFKTV